MKSLRVKGKSRREELEEMRRGEKSTGDETRGEEIGHERGGVEIVRVEQGD